MFSLSKFALTTASSGYNIRFYWPGDGGGRPLGIADALGQFTSEGEISSNVPVRQLGLQRCPFSLSLQNHSVSLDFIKELTKIRDRLAMISNWETKGIDYINDLDAKR